MRHFIIICFFVLFSSNTYSQVGYEHGLGAGYIFFTYKQSSGFTTVTHQFGALGVLYNAHVILKEKEAFKLSINAYPYIGLFRVLSSGVPPVDLPVLLEYQYLSKKKRGLGLGVGMSGAYSKTGNAGGWIMGPQLQVNYQAFQKERGALLFKTNYTFGLNRPETIAEDIDYKSNLLYFGLIYRFQ
jgi:hypothetical protein